MSTDPRLEFIDSVLEAAMLKDATVRGIDLKGELLQVMRTHEKLWETPRHPHYTDHGVGHSRRIINRAVPFFREFDFTSKEVLVFCISAFIHDIGMQFNEWGGLPANEDADRTIAAYLGLDQPPIDLEDARRQHVANGMALCRAEWEAKRTWRNPGPFCSETDYARTLFREAAFIAAAHSGESIWPRVGVEKDITFKESEQRPWSPPQAGRRHYDYRPRLIAGTLRICDELDGQHDRVPDPERFWATSMPDKSRIHWLAAYYVLETRVEFIGDRLVVNLRWRCPESASAEVRKKIRELLWYARADRIQRTIDDVNNAYLASGNPSYLRVAKLTGLDEDPSGEFVQTVNERLEDLLERHREILLQKDSPLSVDLQRASPLAAGAVGVGRRTEEPKDLIPPSDLTRTRSDRGAVGERLYARFFRADRGHYRLARGVHTNVILHCRVLAADPDLIRDIADEIVRGFGDHGFGMVVGVGTSVIPLAVAVGFRLRIPVTFTFFDWSYGASEGARHQRQEVEVVGFSGSGKVLIIDDIISFGKGAAQVIDHVIAKARVPLRAEDIVHLSLFRLGDQPLKTVAGVTYASLVEVKDVYYASDESECALCREGVSLRDEWEA